MRVLLAIGLLFFFLTATVAFSKTPKASPLCERKKRGYFAVLGEGRDKPATCRQDTDCELVFEGGQFSGCDLGEAFSKKDMGEKYFRRLDRARESARESCPTPYNAIRCMAVPYNTVKCEQGVCLPTYREK